MSHEMARPVAVRPARVLHILSAQPSAAADTVLTHALRL